MGKKRGGKDRSQQAKQSAVLAIGEDSKEDGIYQQDAEFSPKSSRNSGHNTMGKALDYLREIQPSLDQMVETFQNTHTQPPISCSVFSEMLLERNLLLSQILQNIKGIEIEVMRTQYGSKAFEKLLFLLETVLSCPLDTLNKTKVTDDATDINEQNAIKDTFNAQDASLAVKQLICAFAADSLTNATHLYSSYCGQHLISIIPTFITLNTATSNSSQVVSANTEASSNTLSIEEVFLYFVESLRTGQTLRTLLFDSCGSHVLRTCFLVLTGFIPEHKGQRRLAVNPTRGGTQSCLPQRTYAVPIRFMEITHAIGEDLLDATSHDMETFCLDPHASPVLQLLFHIAYLKVDCFQAILDVGLRLFLPNTASDADTLKPLIGSLIKSPVGSRLLETVLATASTPALFHNLIWFCLKPDGGINKTATSSFGNYIIQRLSVSSHVGSGSIKCLIDELDFHAVLSSQRGAVLWKLADACRRVQDHYKLFLTKYLQALNAQQSETFPFLWFMIILGLSETEVVTYLKNAKEANEIVPGINESSNDNNHSSISSSAPPDNAGGFARKPRVRLNLDPTGCSILTSLLKFPSDEIHPLLQSFKAFASPQHSEILYALAVSRQGSWFLQTVLDPFSPIRQHYQARLINALLTNVGCLAFSPSGSFVVTAAYRVALPETRKQIAQRLLPHARALFTANYVLYRTIGLGDFEKDAETWNAKATKISKIHKLFEGILRPTSEDDPSKTTTKPDGTVNEHNAQKAARAVSNNNHADHSFTPAKKKPKRRSSTLPENGEETAKPKKKRFVSQSYTLRTTCLTS